MNLAKSPINGYYCPEDPGEPVWNDKRLSVNDLEARILAEFARNRTVLEIGTGLGVATRKMAEVAKSVYTVDIDPWVEEVVVPTFPKNVHFFGSIDKYGIMPGFDMALVDGLHEYEQLLKDVADVRRLVKKGGVLLFHDYALPQVSRALLVSKLNVTLIHTFVGLGLAWNE